MRDCEIVIIGEARRALQLPYPQGSMGLRTF